MTITSIGCSIPMDLIVEILLKLPAKSVWRFRYVSKSWCSIIRSKQFIDQFMSLSLSRPRLVLAFSDWVRERVLFFSSPNQSCSFLSSSSMLVAEKNILKMPEFNPSTPFICKSVRGFVCFRFVNRYVVCNPCTGQFIDLAIKNPDDYCCMYLGYDPNSDQYKVLRLIRSKYLYSHIEYSVLTLGDQIFSQSWRPIKTSIFHNSWNKNSECIDGIVYYKCGIQKYLKEILLLSSFDVGSEQLLDIDTPQDLDLSGDLTNYLGKLALYCFVINSFNLWVLDDVKNQVWSKKTYNFPLLNELPMYRRFSFSGITASGEIVYVPPWFTDSFELVCYNMEKKMGRIVQVTGLSHYIYDADNCSFYSSLLCCYVDNIIYL